MKTVNIFEEHHDSKYPELIQNPNFLNWASSDYKPNIKLDNGLALVDLDWTIRKPKQKHNFKKNKIFINEPKEQELISGINWVLRKLNERRFSIFGISNQGGIEAGHKTLRSTINEMRYTLALTPYLNRIYFAVNNESCWIITRSFIYLDNLPLALNTPSRFQRCCGAFEDDKYEFGGFRKPNKGMLTMAIADWFNQYNLIAKTQGEESTKNRWFENPFYNIDAYDVIADGDFYNRFQSKYNIFMTGDREEDRKASENANVNFIDAKNFLNGNIPQ